MFSDLPLDAKAWPRRGQALAAWLASGVDAFQQLSNQHNSEPAFDSVAHHDTLTVSADTPSLARAGPWFATLTMVGAGELVRSLAVLLDASSSVPLTRGYIPIVRSIQEHLGRVVWLCEPGSIVSGPGDVLMNPLEDNWAERRHRALLAATEWYDDAASHFALIEPESANHTEAEAERDKLRPLVRSSRKGHPERGGAPPGTTFFAERVVAVSTQLHGATGRVPGRAAYKRLSETSHGGLFGLHGDKSINDTGRYVFVQSDADLDAVASNVASFWGTAMLLLGGYLGWDAEAALEPFHQTWSGLYP